MKTTLLFVLVFGACASAAFAEALPPAAGADSRMTAPSHPTGPVALTEAEMDQVAAGAIVNWSADLSPANEVPPVQRDTEGRHTPIFTNYRPQFYLR